MTNLTLKFYFLFEMDLKGEKTRSMNINQVVLQTSQATGIGNRIINRMKAEEDVKNCTVVPKLLIKFF